MDEYRNIARLTKIACVCVAIYLCADLLFSGVAFAADPASSVDDGVVGLTAVAQLLLLLLCVIVVGRWIYVASRNAHQLRDNLEISPGWAVGWYFVPIMNLFKPMQAMREIWNASEDHDGYREGTPAIIGWWWGLWLLSNILGNISFRMNMASVDIHTVAAVDLVSAAVNIPLSLLLITIMRRVAAGQDQRRFAEAFA